MLPFAKLQTVFSRQETQNGIRGHAGIACPEQKFGAIARGQYNHFFDALGAWPSCASASDRRPSLIQKRSRTATGAVR